MITAVHTPDRLEDALEALGEGAWVVAGGTVVLPRINTQPIGSAALVSLRALDLSGVEVDGDEVTVGATTTLADLAAHDRLGFLRTAVRSVASPSVRNLATVGGNLFAKSPYGDLAVCMLALEATVDVAGPEEQRSCPVEEILESGVEPEELVTAVRFRTPAEGTWFYRKEMRRQLSSAAIVTVAAVVSTADGSVDEARLALGGVGPRPLRARTAESALVGGAFDRDSVQQAAEAARGDAQPASDAYASAWYRDRVLPVHIRRALLGS